MPPRSPVPGRARSAEQRVRELLNLSDGLTRRAIGEALDLPQPTVVSAVGRLVQDGVAAEILAGDQVEGDGAGRLGRPAQLVRLAAHRPVLGFLDLAGDSLTAVIADWEGRPLREATFDLGHRPQRFAELEPGFVFLDRSGVEAGSGGPAERLSAVVLSVPAPFQPGVGVPVLAGDERSFAPWLRTDPVPELTARFGVPVVADNNVNLAAFGEYLTGTVPGARNLIGLQLSGTWVGGGLVLGGRVHRGTSGFAGEIGHVHVDDDGPLCVCGGRGCLVSRIPSLLSGPDALYGRTIGTPELLRLAAAGEPGPARVLTDLGRLLGRRVADLCTVLNLDAVIVGGEVGRATDLVAAGIREQIDLYAPPIARSAVTTVTSSLGLGAALLGAVGVVQEARGTRPRIGHQ